MVHQHLLNTKMTTIISNTKQRVTVKRGPNLLYLLTVTLCLVAGYWLGKQSSVVRYLPETTTTQNQAPSQNLLDASCARMYINDMESSGDTRVQIRAVQGAWFELNSSIFCHVVSNNFTDHNGYIRQENNVQTYFSIRKEYVSKRLSESEFKKLTDIQS
ncbi:hypothetical protein AKJ31_20445 [Vibrio hepatarius]|uniref:Uncharacterized protein n=1 Tax=Vibrio hepatarius TaxID=171383 RepID=A0A0M0HUP1_9VIBR|nr:hypothetical protein AKJ31_20445 [Vibrio hepatarius]POC39062.1 hypothetical protein CRN55_07490 [Vibrio vulnificus]